MASLRIMAGFKTQAELCRFMGVDLSMVWYWENGERTPSLETAANYAKSLGVTLDQLYSAIVRTKEKQNVIVREEG